MRIHSAVFALLLISPVTAATAKAPDCSGPDRYPTSEAYVYLKNAGLLGPDANDFDHTETKVIASQRIGRDLWRQVFRVTFPLKSGNKLETIVVSDTSAEECSMGTLQIFLVSKRLY